MDSRLKTSLWQQFGAALDTLEDAINLCPDALWTAALWNDTEDARYGQFWYIAYHTLSWTDLYLGSDYEGFRPPVPFIRGRLPEQPYTKDQIRAYLAQCRSKCQSTIESLTDEQAFHICTFNWIQATYWEMQLYSMRHVQEHAAQLNLMLGENGVTGIDWIAQARVKST
jgi:hypothetical protein